MRNLLILEKNNSEDGDIAIWYAKRGTVVVQCILPLKRTFDRVCMFIMEYWKYGTENYSKISLDLLSN